MRSRSLRRPGKQMPDPGEFNALVRFDYRGPDANGDPIGPFLPGFQRNAKLDYLRGSEKALESRIEGLQPVVMIVHDDPDTQRLTTGWRAEVLDGRGVRVGDFINLTAVAPDRSIGFTNILGKIGGAVG